MSSTATIDLSKRAPASGGFNLTFLRLEVRRLMRNRRTMIFTVLMPVAFYFAFGFSQRGQTLGHANAAAYVMVSLAAYGAMVAAVSGAAMVAVERAQGWSRQLRLTPLSPGAYLATKVLTAMTLALVPVVVELVLGGVTGVRLSIMQWVLCGLAAWLCSMVFAALGLMVGYLLPSENVMQIMGAAVALLAFLGGLFVPLALYSQGLRDVARFTPAYGLGMIARAPLHAEAFDWWAVVNLVGWTLIFSVAAMLLFRRDTKRV